MFTVMRGLRRGILMRANPTLVFLTRRSGALVSGYWDEGRLGTLFLIPMFKDVFDFEYL